MSENDYKETLQKLLKCLFNYKKVYFVDDSVVVWKKIENSDKEGEYLGTVF